MWKINLLAALRNLRRQKFFSAVNLVGMALGMAIFAVFALTAGVKLNADRFHENADHIFGVVQIVSFPNGESRHTAFLPAPLAPALQKEIPGFQAITRIMPAGNLVVRQGSRIFSEQGGLFVDSGFLSTFSFSIKEGDPEKALDSPGTAVITETMAEKYFGSGKALGQVLTIGKQTSVIVTGIVKDVPRTSSLRFDFLLSMETAGSLLLPMDDWNIRSASAFVLLSKDQSESLLEELLPAFNAKYFPGQESPVEKTYLFPFTDFRLNSSHILSLLPNSHPVSVISVLMLGVLVLLVVSINFINLSTARAMHRSREIGIRKVAGARRSQLIRQFLGESTLTSFLALPGAIILYELIHPIISSYLNIVSQTVSSSQVSNSIWNYPFLLKYLVIAALLTGLFSGLYPAFFLSSFRPVRILKGSPGTGRKKRRGSKIMIILQFAMAVIFIAVSGVVTDQFDNLYNADLGWDRQNIAAVRLNAETKERLDLLKTEYSRLPQVKTVTSAADMPILWSNPQPARPPQSDEKASITLQAYGVDYGFIEALQISITQGRAFNKSAGDDNAFIITETAARRLGYDQPVGKTIRIKDRIGPVIGIAEDFLFDDIGLEFPPAALIIDRTHLSVLLIRSESSSSFLRLKASLEKKWYQIFPDFPFECRNIEEAFDDVFGIMSRIAGFLKGIGIAVILLSCLGLLGLASYSVERRIKEIGIRKIMGASSLRITWTVARQYFFLVCGANAAALLLIYFGWKKVLQLGILFITDIGPGVYISAVMISLSAALIAIISQTQKAVTMNPADSLRAE